MKLEGDFTFDGPREKVWEALLDPEVIAKAMPGCDKLEKTGENEYRGALAIRIGPVQGKFQGTVKLSDLKSPESYKMVIDGRGPSGFMKGEGQLRLEAPAENQTRLHYSVEAQVGGRIASVGQRLLDTTSKSIARQSLESLNRQVQAHAQAGESDEPPPEVEAPSTARVAAEVAKDVVSDVADKNRGAIIGGGVAAVAVLLLIIWYFWG